MPRRAKLSGLERAILTIKSIRDYEAGLSLKQIAKKHGSHHSTISMLLKEAHVPVKRVGRPHKEI